MLELWTLCTALPRLMIFPYMKFHFNSISTSKVIVRTKSEKKYQQRAITQKILMLELWTLCTALPRLMIFPYMKFHFNSTSRSGVIVRTKSVTDRQQTDRQTTTDNSDKNNMSPPYIYGGRHNYKRL
jgi:hypothetical protein